MSELVIGLLIIGVVTAVVPFSKANLEEVKAVSTKQWSEMGYTITGYEGYQHSSLVSGCEGGKSLLPA